MEIAASGAAVGVAVAFVGGLVVVALLIWAVRAGIGVRRHESRRPRPEEQPRLPESGPVGEIHEVREPNEMPQVGPDGERLLPHQIDQAGSRPNEDQKRRRWSGSGGV
ncbi:DUF6479 family protein [Streptomyces sp. NPDC005423]|uniref:DUF6479 family protein n=1 Tax=Streptomyces sp. NPDC005423 TaxID=3155343 RepID=UPI0033AB7EB9